MTNSKENEELTIVVDHHPVSYTLGEGSHIDNSGPEYQESGASPIDVELTDVSEE